MMDGFHQSLFGDQRLQTSLREILRSQFQHVIEFDLILLEKTIAIDTCVSSMSDRPSIKDALRIILLQHEQCPSSIADLGQGHLDTPQLSLVFQSMLANQLQLGIQPLLFKWTTWML